MADFIMTMSSDDERPSKPSASTSAPASAGASKKAKANPSKLSRKQQLEAARKLKKQKRKTVDSASDLEHDSEPPAGSDEEGGMTADFVFDGLGGGFVGDRRNQVWDAGIDYVTKKHANPRLTVDQIIARRAPERESKEKRRAARAAAAEEEEEGEEEEGEGAGGDDESADELELEMMSDLEAELGEDEDDEDESEDDIERPEGAKASGSDDDEEEEEDNEAEGAKPKKASVEVDDGENWLGLGEKSSGEEESDEDDEEPAADGELATGFAALADVEDEASGSDDDDTPIDLRRPAATKADKAADAATAAEAAAAKAYFTSHANTAASSSSAASFGTIPNATLSRQLLLALGSLNLHKPTPIQRECIPIAMMGKDIVASSATGSGKTVAFWVGVLERLLHRDRRNPTTRVVVMTPTRELAVQVHGVGVALARYTDIQFCLCVGGLSLKVQEAELKQRPDIVVSTPGRLIDHVRNTPCFSMDGVEVLVLDEADRMLEEGFKAELEEIISAAPRSRQTLLFSATVTESVASLGRLSMNKPVRVKIDEMGATASGLIQEFLRVRGDKAGEAIERGFRSGERSREALLVALCTRSFASGRTIVFFRSKAQAHRMKIIFSLHGEGLERSDELHGDLTQEQRLASLTRFREGQSAFLLATDLASRGLDIKGIENVINYEMPKSIEIYLHRVGRTARAGKKGRALTLVGESDRKLVKLAMKHAPPESIKQRVIPPEVITEVSNELKELEGEVKAVQREEKEEKEFRKGDMELLKGRNMLEHEAEIMARPARTWFQTSQEKLIAKGLGLAEHNGKFAERGANEKKRKAEEDDAAKAKRKERRDPLAGLSRKEKRRRQAALDDREDAEEGTTKEINSAVRNAKKASRPARLTVAAPERDKGFTAKKPKKGGFFDRELFGAAGKVEGAGAPRPRPATRPGGSAGKPRGTGKAMGPKPGKAGRK